MLTERQLGGGIRGRAGRTSSAEYSGLLHCGFTVTVSVCVYVSLCASCSVSHSAHFWGDRATFCLCVSIYSLCVGLWDCQTCMHVHNSPHIVCPWVFSRPSLDQGLVVSCSVWGVRKPSWHQRGERWEAGAKGGRCWMPGWRALPLPSIPSVLAALSKVNSVLNSFVL